MTDESDDPERDPLAPFDDGPTDGPSPRSRDDAGGSVDAPADSASRDAPLDDLARSVRERRESAGEAEPDLFEEREVAEIDADAVWERLEGEAPTREATEERTVRVVEKADYCEGCPHFSSPPDVHCTHEGTEILELVDVDRFRVAGCPVVHEEERLEEL